LPERCQLRATARQTPVIVFTAAANAGRLAGWAADGATVVPISDSEVSVDAVLAELGRRRMTNVLVEGGAGVQGAFRDAGAVDEVWAFVAPVLVGGADARGPVGGAGVVRLADAVRSTDVTVERLGPDVLMRVQLR
jgi:diaminohydroxyphosphoribosylaminopyrimidine deaminase/5-amino-6-(5-phosphoribosylamino)uracil reductase